MRTETILIRGKPAGKKMLQTLTAYGGRKIDPITNESELPL